MNEQVKEKWLIALRSGEYQQGKHRLKSVNNFCCLGVLCDIHSKQSENVFDNADAYMENTSTLPQQVIDWAGLKSPSPNVINTNITLAGLNDAGKSFIEIADLIEKHL